MADSFLWWLGAVTWAAIASALLALACLFVREAVIAGLLVRRIREMEIEMGKEPQRFRLKLWWWLLLTGGDEFSVRHDGRYGTVYRPGFKPR
jgi:hypothetical protein